MRARRPLPAIHPSSAWSFSCDWGWIDGERIAGLAGRSGPVDFEEVEARKLPLLYEAAGNFLDRGPHDPELAAQWERV